MKVSELIEKLRQVPQDGEVMVERGGAYNDCRSVQVHTRFFSVDNPFKSAIVFLSDEEETNGS